MSAEARRRRQRGDEALDVELIDLPPAARWREWMLRVEAAIFASARPVPREGIVKANKYRPFSTSKLAERRGNS